MKHGIALFLVLVIPVAGAFADFGDPRGFLADEQVTETVLYPGVTLFRVDGREAGTAQVTHVVTVDLSDPNISLKALPGDRFVHEPTGQFFRRSYVSHLQADNKALVAINTHFFDIASTMAPLGLLIKDGVMLREPGTGFNTLVFTEDRLPLIGNFGFIGEIRHGATSLTLSGVNLNNLKSSEIVLYQQPWDRSPGTSADFTTGEQIVEVVVQKTRFEKAPGPAEFSLLRGQVIEVRENQPSKPISADEFVLSAIGLNRFSLLTLMPGAEVEARWRLTGGPGGVTWNTITEGVAGNHLLMTNGVKQVGGGPHWENRHPRSAIGINSDGSRIVLLLVEGRQGGRAEGMSLHAVASYLEHLGSHNALEFDGGGSSALAARVGGTNQLVSTPSGSVERYVPAGLGVHVEEENPFFQEISLTTGEDGAVLSWTTAAPSLSYVRFGWSALDLESGKKPFVRTRHTALLENLAPGTVYFAQLVVGSGAGEKTSQLLTFTPGLQVTMDNSKAVFGGDDWRTGAFPTPHGADYRWTFVTAGEATHTATYQPEIPRSGIYDLHTWFVHGGNRTTRAPYTIHHSQGENDTTIDQTSGGSQWRRLALDLHFEAGTDGKLVTHNADGIGDGKVVIVDAFRWVLKAPDPLPPGTLPAWWTRHFFGEEPPAKEVDTDGDGFSLWQEYLWATDPTDPRSSPQFRLEKAGADSWRAFFSPFHEQRDYRLYSSSNLVEGDWQLLENSSPRPRGVGGGVFEFSAAAAGQFFRLEVEKQ